MHEVLQRPRDGRQADGQAAADVVPGGNTSEAIAAASPETVTGFAAPRPCASGAVAPAAVTKAPSVRRGQLSEFLAGAIDRPQSPRPSLVDPPTLSLGGAMAERGQSGPGGTWRAWGSASVPPQPGQSLADLLGRGGLQRNDSAGRSLAAGVAGGSKSAKARGVKLSLAEFHAKQPPPETPATERSSLSSGIAWGRSGGAVSSAADAHATPPSLSAIMSDEGSKRRGGAEGQGGAASGCSGPRRLVPERGSAGSAWQTADISALRRAVIDEGLFEQASRLPDIRPNGAESAWGRSSKTVTRIDDILSEQAASAMQESLQSEAMAVEDAAGYAVGGGAGEEGHEPGQGRGRGRGGGGGQKKPGRGGRSRRQRGPANGEGSGQARRAQEQGVGPTQEMGGAAGEAGEAKRGGAREGGGRRGGRRQGKGCGQGPVDRAEGAARAGVRRPGGQEGEQRSAVPVGGSRA